MSTRNSGYDRADLDHYPTPAWVVEALLEHFSVAGETVWEPACGAGLMAEAISRSGAMYVIASDVHDHGYRHMTLTADFLAAPSLPVKPTKIITNPPYGKRGGLAHAFIRAGLPYVAAGCAVALLLPVDFDSAKSRRDVFGDCPWFDAKIMLTKRICWFERSGGSSSPSQNHAWFIWRRKAGAVQGSPVIRYAPNEERLAA